jgi:hypothetical protein
LIHPNAASRSNISTRSFLLGFSCATAALATAALSLPAFAQAPSPERQTQAATLVTEAITLAERESKVANSRTRLTVVRGRRFVVATLVGLGAQQPDTALDATGLHVRRVAQRALECLLRFF